MRTATATAGGVSERRAAALASMCLVFMMLLGLNASAASADAQFGLEFTRDEAQFPIVHRGDERVDYAVKVSNTASPTLDVGAELFCNGIEINGSTDPKDWTPGGVNSPTSFAIEWVRNGVPIAGAGGAARRR